MKQTTPKGRKPGILRVTARTRYIMNSYSLPSTYGSTSTTQSSADSNRYTNWAHCTMYSLELLTPDSRTALVLATSHRGRCGICMTCEFNSRAIQNHIRRMFMIMMLMKRTFAMLPWQGLCMILVMGHSRICLTEASSRHS